MMFNFSLSTDSLRATSTALLVSISIALVGCASKSPKVEKIKPATLPKIQSTVSLQNIFQQNGSASAKYDTTCLQMAQQDKQYYVALANGTVTAFNAQHQSLWKVHPTKSITAGVAIGQGIISVANEHGQLFALDSKTGKTLWQIQLNAAILSLPLISQGRVITMANDGSVTAHDAQSGQLIWGFSLPNSQLSLRGYAPPSLLDERTVLLPTNTGFVYALDVLTGTLKWQRRVAVNDARGDLERVVDVRGQPVIIGDKMVTSSFQGQVTVTDTKTQHIIWSNDASSLVAPAVDNQAVYLVKDNDEIQAYDLYTGEPLWKNDQLLHRRLSNPVVLSGKLVVGDYQGVLHVLNPATGALIGREKTSGDVCALTSAEGELHVATRTGQNSIWIGR